MATSYTLLNGDNSRKCLLTIGFLCFIIAFISGCVFLSLRILYDVKQHQTFRKFSKNSIETKCFVENYNLVEKTSSIISAFSKDNSPTTSVLHDGLYQVKYQLKNQSHIQSTICVKDSSAQSNKQINSEYSCFYDRTNVTHVVWDLKPSESNLQSIIFMSLGLGVMVVIFSFIFVRILPVLCQNFH